jgi:uncharacterized protein
MVQSPVRVHALDLLPSLAQQVRARKLNPVRWILWGLGLFIAASGLSMYSFSDALARAVVDEQLKEEIGGRHNLPRDKKAEIQEIEEVTSRALEVAGALGAGLGVSYLLLGLFVKRYPGPITIAALAMFVACNAVLLATNEHPEELAAVWPWWAIQVGVLVVLVRSIYSAIAYERERLHQGRRRQELLEQEALALETAAADSNADGLPSRRQRPPPLATFKEDVHRIKLVLIFFGMLLGLSVVFGLIVHFDGPAVGGKEEIQKELLNEMLIFDAFSSTLVLAALCVSGRPPRIERPLSRCVAAWCLGAPVLGLVLAVNIVYCGLLQDYVGKQPHLEFIQVNFQTDFWLVLLCLCIQPAVIEELFFRYLALGQLRRIMNDHSAIWVSAVMFGFAHLHNPFGMPVLVLCGAALGYMRVMSGGLMLPMLMHGFHNAIVTMIDT